MVVRATAKQVDSPSIPSSLTRESKPTNEAVKIKAQNNKKISLPNHFECSTQSNTNNNVVSQHFNRRNKIKINNYYSKTFGSSETATKCGV